MISSSTLLSEETCELLIKSLNVKFTDEVGVEVIGMPQKRFSEGVEPFIGKGVIDRFANVSADGFFASALDIVCGVNGPVVNEYYTEQTLTMIHHMLAVQSRGDTS